VIPANLRLNADDFGLDPSLSRAILDGARRGLVNSVSVVPFQDDDSARLLAELIALPGVRVGAHLTYIQVPFLTRPAGFPDGVPPPGYRDFLAAYARGRIRSAEVAAEWRAQIELLQQRAGRPLSHIDGHQHLHLLPPLWRVARALQAEFGVELLRRPAEASRRAWLKDFPMGAGLQVLAISRPGPHSERFFGVGTSMSFRADAYRAMAAEIAAHPERRYELMVHPGEDPRGRRELDEVQRWLGYLTTRAT
jgi:predicted glycoside hydrolase/deacetylase ChbG (UPF0249 family)